MLVRFVPLYNAFSTRALSFGGGCGKTHILFNLCPQPVVIIRDKPLLLLFFAIIAIATFVVAEKLPYIFLLLFNGHLLPSLCPRAIINTAHLPHQMNTSANLSLLIADCSGAFSLTFYLCQHSDSPSSPLPVFYSE